MQGGTGGPAYAGIGRKSLVFGWRTAKGIHMTKGRLEAFTDGVIAVIITIMVLELKVPHDADPKALAPLIPVFPELRAQLRVRRHLLEQPPPHVSCGPPRQRRDPVGQPASAVLAVARAVRHGVDG